MVERSGMRPILASASGSSRPPLTKSYRWLVVAMLWCVCFFNYADRQAIFSVFPFLKSELHLSDVQLGIAGSSFMWMYALFGPIAGWLCDLISRRAIVLGALLFWSVATAGTALAHTFPQLVVWRTLGGLSEAFYFPAAMSLISDYHAVDTRSRAMSIHQSSVYVGTAAGGALSGLLAEHFANWRVSFLVFGPLGILLALVLLATLREPPRGMSDAGFVPPNLRLTLPARIKDVVSRGQVLLLIVTFIGANFVAVIFLTWIPAFLYRKFHMGVGMAGVNGTIYISAASCAGALFGGWLADLLAVRRLRQTGRSRGARMLTQSLGLLLGSPFLFLSGYGRSIPAVLIAMTCFGLCKGIYDSNIWAALYDVIPLEQRGTAAGLMNSLGWLGGGVAPVAVAVASARVGMSACISTTALIYLALGLMLYANARRQFASTGETSRLFEVSS
jgi:MFS family permease